MAVKKKALMLSPAFATINVVKKVPERHKYGISDQSIFEHEREEDDFQPTKKQHTKPGCSKFYSDALTTCMSHWSFGMKQTNTIYPYRQFDSQAGSSLAWLTLHDKY